MFLYKKVYILLLFFCLVSQILKSQTGGANICIDAEPICSSDEFTFPNTYDGSSAEIGPDYGCLFTQPNPAWFFLQIAQSGDVELIIEQSNTQGGPPNLDVDFILYGPFINVIDACNSSLTASNTIDCSYSNNAVEQANIPNAISGQFYLLLVTNYSGSRGFISIEQIAGGGTTSCAILEVYNACDGEELTLDATTPNADSYLWYVEDVSNPGNYILINGVNTATYDVYISENYRAEAIDSSGGLMQLYDFNVEFLETPTYPAIVQPYIICDYFEANDGIAEFELNTKTPDILNGLDPTLYTVTYYANDIDAQVGENQLPSIYINTANPETIYARIDNTASTIVACFAIGSFNLEVNIIPEINLDETYLICINKNGTEVISNPVLNTELNDNEYTFEWVETTNPTIILSTQSVLLPIQGGVYSVLVTNILTSCINTATTTVLESSPPTVITNLVTEAYANNHIIEVKATGEGSALFEFSIDNGPWVSNEPNSNAYTFSNVPFGEHVIQARDINGCGIAIDEVLVMDYPLFFTPNGDGYNDTWQIFGIENQYDAIIYIFDQYGKLLKQLSPTGPGWDGSYNGKLMPETDYWFVVTYRELGESEGAQKQYRSHFSLKR